MMKTDIRPGFTLAEVMIAIAIVGLLAAIGGPMFMSYLAKGKVTATKQNLRIIKGAVDQFNADMGQNPETLKDLVKKPANPDLAKDWNPYINKKEIPLDGWNHPFVYKPTPDGEHDYELYSYGPKGKAGKKDTQINAWDL